MGVAVEVGDLAALLLVLVKELLILSWRQRRLGLVAANVGLFVERRVVPGPFD